MRRLGVRASLSILAVGCVLPISAVSALLIDAYYEREQARVTVDAISRARAMMSAVDRDFDSIEASLWVLSTSFPLEHGNLRDFHVQAAGALEHMNADSILLVDASGQVLLSTRVRYGEPLPRLARPALLERIVSSGRSGVSDLFTGPLVGEPIVTVGVPVRRGHAVAGSLNATLRPNQLVNLLTEQRLPDSWRAAILDSTGTIVARSHDMAKFLGVKAAPAVVQRLPEKQEDGFRGTTVDGIPVLTVYSRSMDTRWSVLLGMPLAEVTRGLRESLAWLIVAVCLALVIGLGLAWWVGGRIARSIIALAEPARQLGAGERVILPPLQFREANELGCALTNAAAALGKARHEAHHDALTGLANGVLFRIAVDQQLATCRRYKRLLAVMVIDLDGFKAVNDAHGHAAGDQLLREVSRRVLRSVRASDIAARIGGDEFAICLLETGLSGAEQAARKLIDALSQPFELGGPAAHISASIGIAAYPPSADETESLLKKADSAMYQAKSSGKNQVCTA